MSDQIINALIVGNQLALQSTNNRETYVHTISDDPIVDLLLALVGSIDPIEEGASLIITTLLEPIEQLEEFGNDTIKCCLAREWSESTTEYNVFHQL